MSRIPTLEEAQMELEMFRQNITEEAYLRLKKLLPQLYEDGHAVLPCVWDIRRWK